MPLGSKRKDKDTFNDAPTVTEQLTGTYYDDWTDEPVGEGSESPTNGTGVPALPEIEDTADDSVFKSTRTVTKKDNPFVKVLRDSWNENQKGKRVPATSKDEAKSYVNMLRRAGDDLHSEGISVRIVDSHDTDGYVYFRAKPYTPKPRKDKSGA